MTPYDIYVSSKQHPLCSPSSPPCDPGKALLALLNPGRGATQGFPSPSSGGGLSLPTCDASEPSSEHFKLLSRYSETTGSASPGNLEGIGTCGKSKRNKKKKKKTKGGLAQQTSALSSAEALLSLLRPPSLLQGLEDKNSFEFLKSVEKEKLVKLESLPSSDLRYMRGLFSELQGEYFFNALKREAFHEDSARRWRPAGRGRFVHVWTNPPGRKYSFSNGRMELCGSAFPPFLDVIKRRLQVVLGPVYGEDKVDFNFCVANLYMDRWSGVNWHSDNEEAIDLSCPIVGVSFGETRTFSLVETRKSKIDFSEEAVMKVPLESASMVVMAGNTQKDYLHAVLPEEEKVEAWGGRGGRISLTFRMYKDAEE